MPARGAILAYVREKFGTEPEYPWARYPHYAVLRQQQGRKWYALIMDVPPDRLGLAGDGPVEIINLKSDGALDLLRACLETHLSIMKRFNSMLAMAI